MPWWWWPPAIGLASLMAAQVHMGHPGVRAWLPYLVTVPVAVVVLIRTGRRRVRLDGGELWVGDAHIPLRHLGRVQVIARAEKRRVLGPELDPAAFVQHSAWIGPMVRVEVTDPADPTPYWIFSVRRAAELAELLRTDTAARTDSAGQADDGAGGAAPSRQHPGAQDPGLA